MNKYQPLADYLQKTEFLEVKLTFQEIENIIKSKLPFSAKNFPAFWANSKTNDSHTWAHLWLKAGWVRTSYKLSEEWVIFKKTEYYELSDKKALEGYQYDSQVILRTRNAALAKARKIKDDYTCQACGYYHQLNNSHVIEVHHIDPLSASEAVETTLDKLVSLCPNCHRIAHLRSMPYSVNEIKELLNDSFRHSREGGNLGKNDT